MRVTVYKADNLHFTCPRDGELLGFTSLPRAVRKQHTFYGLLLSITYPKSCVLYKKETSVYSWEEGYKVFYTQNKKTDSGHFLKTD
jgi:hypothetical protein